MTDLLRDAQPQIALDVPPVDVRAAARAMEAGTASAGQQQRLWRFIVAELCGLTQLPMALPGEASVINWRAGRRYVGCYLEAARLMPADDPPPPEQRPRTMTERVRRGNTSTT